jgi:hypothetical protein
MEARTRTLRSTIATLVAVVAVLVLAGVVAASPLYGGCAIGSTPERAISKAIKDTEISAEGDGLFTCTIVGEPSVWFVPVQNNPGEPGGYYRAAVDMACS